MESASIASIGYDAAVGTLEVEFRSGGVYHYYAVPREVHRAFLAADSHGRFFRTSIRDRYPCRRADQP
ncbi:KTSC domain-containing protein [Amycolatopsis sp. NEAU-NG30]|uniref:KTSC domain-containing protein n=1 Tax=Amycolatopsis melonis TaxID=3156488 RepID=A0ABV0LT17_9PSEU